MQAVQDVQDLQAGGIQDPQVGRAQDPKSPRAQDVQVVQVVQNAFRDGTCGSSGVRVHVPLGNWETGSTVEM